MRNRPSISKLGKVLLGSALLTTPISITTVAHASTDVSFPKPIPTQHEPMNTQVKNIDGVNVLFQYGEPVPSFGTWQLSQLTRQYISLDKQWKFKEDPGNVGLKDGWYKNDYNDSSWNSESVPMAWDLYDTPDFGKSTGQSWGQGSAFYDGFAWYRTTMNVPASWKHKFITINFLAVNYQAWIYVNGNLVGEHEGSNIPFSMDIGKYVHQGENSIAVRVYRRPTFNSYTAKNKVVTNIDTEVPAKPVDYWPYAGIVQSAYVQVTSGTVISKILTATGDHTLTADMILYNHTDKQASRLLVVDPGEGTGAVAQSKLVTLEPNQVKVVTMNFAIPKAQWWTSDNPKLYTLTARLYKGHGVKPRVSNSANKGSLCDSLSTTYGMRVVSVQNGKLTLNNHPIFLKGVDWYSEMPNDGVTLTKQQYDEELGQVVKLHANFIRNNSYPRVPYVYDYTNHHGIMVMDEAPNMWLSTNEEKLQLTYGLSRAMVLSMVWNEEDDPSVILWSLEDESSSSNPTIYREWLSQMKQAAKSLDIQNRPVTWASNTSWDPAYKLADVLGVNEYWGYFYGKDSGLTTMLNQMHSTYPNKPILITENGTWSYAGKYGSASTPGTENWQAQQFLNHWSQVTAPNIKPFMAGYSYWVLKDYKERDNYNQSLNGISAMGLMTFDMKHKRLVYTAFQQAKNPVKYSSEPQP